MVHRPGFELNKCHIFACCSKAVPCAFTSRPGTGSNTSMADGSLRAWPGALRLCPVDGEGVREQPTRRRGETVTPEAGVSRTAAKPTRRSILVALAINAKPSGSGSGPSAAAHDERGSRGGGNR